ncbi:MAG: hypothetical protein E7011_03030, partial [Alphaproteobacteria bacterium]|nr:hypothetical protein [Alphaproteobacteria bacterium]
MFCVVVFGAICIFNTPSIVGPAHAAYWECMDDGDCKDGYSCISGECVDPSDSGDDDCDTCAPCGAGYSGCVNECTGTDTCVENCDTCAPCPSGYIGCMNECTGTDNCVKECDQCADCPPGYSGCVNECSGKDNCTCDVECTEEPGEDGDSWTDTETDSWTESDSDSYTEDNTVYSTGTKKIDRTETKSESCEYSDYNLCSVGTCPTGYTCTWNTGVACTTCTDTGTKSYERDCTDYYERDVEDYYERTCTDYYERDCEETCSTDCSEVCYGNAYGDCASAGDRCYGCDDLRTECDSPDCDTSCGSWSYTDTDCDSWSWVDDWYGSWTKVSTTCGSWTLSSACDAYCTPVSCTCTLKSQTCNTLCTAVSNTSSTSSGSESCTIANGTGTRTYTNTCNGKYTNSNCYSAGQSCSGCSSWARTSTGTCNVTSCTTDYYASSSTACTPVGTGYYSANGSTGRTACTNKPANSYYTGSGGGSNACGWACNAGYYKSGSSCVQCESGYYCPGNNSRYNCPDPYTYAPTSLPANYFSSSVESATIVSGSGLSSADRCYALFWFTNARGGFYEYMFYNSSAGRYVANSPQGWHRVNPGYYLTNRAGCGSYAYYYNAEVCPAGSYCPGKATVVCNGSNQSTVHTTNFGLNSCPSGYPNSSAGSDAITDCYSGTKSRAWSGSQTACSKPSGCASVSCNTCSIAACDYVAYSNSAGTGDGTIKSGCSSNSAACQQTVKSVTANANRYVSGTTCPACGSSYPYSDGGSISSAYCYSLETNTGSQLACSTPSGCASSTCGTCTPGTCNWRDYKSATDTSCTPTNCTKPVASVMANANRYVSGTTCPACPTAYPSSDGGNIGEGSCYVTKTSTGSQ